MDLELEQRRTQRPDIFELRVHGRLIARVNWQRDPERREQIGWHLIPDGAPTVDHRLDVDPLSMPWRATVGHRTRTG